MISYNILYTKIKSLALMVVFTILDKNKINHNDQIRVNGECGIPEMFLVKKSRIDNVEFVGLFS